MLSLFFTYGSELPPDVGFAMFGPAHILWLLAGTAATVLLARLYKRACEEERRRTDKTTGWFLVALIALRSVYLALAGALTVWELPLHLCSMAGFLCLLHAYIPADWLGQTLYALCLPGTFAALVFPDWTYYPPIHCITTEGFLFHFGVAVYVVFQLISARIRPSVRGLWKVFLFLAAAVPPVYWFNRRFGTNYMFVNVPSPGSPLEWFAAALGVPGYLFGYAALVAAVVFLMEALGGAAERRDR